MAESKQRREYGSGSISQRADGTWTARMVIGVNEKGRPRIKALYGKTEREVKKKLKDFQKEFYKNDQSVVQRSTVENYMRTWLYENKQNLLKPKSFDRLEQTVLYQVIPLVGHIQLAAFQSSDVQTMLNTLKKNGLSYSTVKKAYDAVNECFRTGVIQKTVLFNPALGVAVPAKKTFGKSEIRYYNNDEVDKLCEAATSVYTNGKRVYRLGDGIIVDLNTGLRMAELLALKWTEVDFEHRRVVVNATRVIVKDRTDDAEHKYTVIEQDSAKTATSIREIDMNDACYEALMRLKEITGEFDYVLSTKDGNPMTPRYLDRMLRKIAVAAGFSEDKVYGLHALRHTFASRLFAAGEDVKTVSELLGHSDITITYNTYIHLINEQKRKAVRSVQTKS
ncbi:MAG: site-specific integrase [Ruminococcaceae bacterium]|nr:site-specific integrase [Oscillospiraceae bacterium]